MGVALIMLKTNYLVAKAKWKIKKEKSQVVKQ
jgi:hypothetical protein